VSGELFITGFGGKVAPRLPFAVSFRPPKMLLAHGGKQALFGPVGDGLGFTQNVDEVAEHVGEYPNVPVYAVYTRHFYFPVTVPFTLSSVIGRPWPFELQLENPGHADEMLFIRGPLEQPLALPSAMGTMRVVGSGSITKNNGAARWSEGEYAVQGATWRQRLYALTLFSTQRLGEEHPFALIAQCPVERADTVFAASDAICRDLGHVSGGS
jgi:hypothetical protein